MAIQTTCPRCLTVYDLADVLRGQKVRCKRCEQAFVVGDAPAGADEPLVAEEVLEAQLAEEVTPALPLEIAGVDVRAGRAPAPQPARAPAPVHAFDMEDEFSIRRPPAAGSFGVILVIVGSIAGLAILATVGTAVGRWALRPSEEPPAQLDGFKLPADAFRPPNLPAPPAVPVPPPPGEPAGETSVVLSNARVLRDRGPHLSVTVDYRFERGRAGPGTRYVLVLRSARAFYVVNYHSHELSDRGTLSARGFAMAGDRGPFDLSFEVEPIGRPRARQRISNTISASP